MSTDSNPSNASLYLRIMGIAVLVILSAAVLGFVSDSLDLVSYKFFAVRRADAQHNAFKASPLKLKSVGEYQ